MTRFFRNQGRLEFEKLEDSFLLYIPSRDIASFFQGQKFSDSRQLGEQMFVYIFTNAVPACLDLCLSLHREQTLWYLHSHDEKYLSYIRLLNARCTGSILRRRRTAIRAAVEAHQKTGWQYPRRF